jgi:hypothetical protein
MGHPRRELTVSWPTVAARLGRSCWPAFLSVPLERILARFAYRAQQTGEPETRRRPNNLWAPVGGDRGAAGPFSQEARRRSLQLWAATHRAATAVAGVLLGAAGLLAVAYLARRA